MDNIDLIDKKILAVLEKDARTPLTQIAKKTRISTQLAKFRLERLEKNNIISGYYSVYDITQLGYTSYRILVSLMNTNKKKHEEIITFLSKYNNIMWLVTCGGRYDLIFNVIARNPAHLQKLLSGIMSKFPDQMKNYIISTTVSANIFGRKFLGMKVQDEPYFGGEKEVIKLDELDKNILKELSRNVRINSSELSIKLNVDARTIINRINSLKKKQIIQGFKPIINLEKIGYQAHKIVVKLNYRDEDIEKKLYQYCKQSKDVTYFLRMIGNWEIEIEPEFENQNELKNFILELKDNFSEIIKDLEIIPLYKDYFYDYYPDD
jgi:DNA-binding Lrp family transcriptional regulator